MKIKLIKQLCLLAIFITIIANCPAQEKIELPEIKVIEVKAEEVGQEVGQEVKEEQMLEFVIHLRDGVDANNSTYQAQFGEYIKQFVSKAQKEYFQNSSYYYRNYKPHWMTNRAHRVGDKFIMMYAVSREDAETMIYKFIEFFNNVNKRNLENLPNEVIEAKKQLQELKQKKLKAEEELSEVNKKLEGIREYPSEYIDADMERVKAEFNDLRFLKKKTDIEIAGIKARIEKAKAVRVSGEVGVIQQHVMNLYTEAEIMYADARARNAHVSELIEKYLLAITLYNKSRKLPETIRTLASIARSKNKSISWLEAEINDPQRNLRGHRKPLNVLDITIYDNSKNQKN